MLIASCASTKTAEQKAAEKHLAAMRDSLDNKHAIDAINDGNFILLADKISLLMREEGLFRCLRTPISYMFSTAKA